MKSKRNRVTRLLSAALAVSYAAMLICGCGSQKVRLDPKNPVVIKVWHYYNGAIVNAFNAIVEEFNETVGREMGIIVEGAGMGNVSDLEAAVIASANKEVGSLDMPNIFASYADTAYQAEKMGLLADLGDYFSKEEQAEYIDSYIEEGKIGIDGELRILPIAKSTEVLMLNNTDWLPFAEACGLTYDDLSTMEGVARVSELYYDWTDARTPAVPNDGKSFFGRDSMANMFIAASREFGTEIFNVTNGIAKIDVNLEAMRKIWDFYYVPYISGYYSAYGKFCSDDAKVGDILAYIGSTSSSSYFPTEVTTDGKAYPVKAMVLPAPGFGGSVRTLIQQGAGMVVTNNSKEEEYASVVFLKWFTQEQNNIKFSALSGYMPVKKTANDYDKIVSAITSSSGSISDITENTLRTALNEISQSLMYTNKAFDGGAEARSVLDSNLRDIAAADREAVIEMLNNGKTLKEAVASINTDEYFNAWVRQFTQELEEAAK